MKFRPLRGIRYMVLSILSSLWEQTYRIWRFGHRYGLFQQNTFQVPIVSIGNLTFGGTGKTPFVIWLGRALEEQNKKVMILIRGYRGKLEHSGGFLKAGPQMRRNPAFYGDEAILLSQKLSNAAIVVGKKRSNNLDYYFDQELPDVVLLDDGHQHLKLERNLNIVLFDALMPLEDYRVAPLGYMREGFDALREADIIVIGRADLVSSERIKELEDLIAKHGKKNIPCAKICYRPVKIQRIDMIETMEISDFKGQQVICVTGIASAAGFYGMLETLGAVILKRYSFPDHYVFKAHEIRSFVDEAERLDAKIMITEKDAVKMHQFFHHERVFYLEIDVHFISGEKEVRDMVNKAIETR